MFTFHHHHHHGGIGNVYLSEGSQAVPACPCGKVGSRRVLKNALCIVLRQWRPVENEKGYQYSSHVASTVHMLPVQFTFCQYSSRVASHAKQHSLSVYKYFYEHVVKFIAKNLSQPRAAGYVSCSSPLEYYGGSRVYIALRMTCIVHF